MYDVIVIGAGPAGITASIYAKRAGLKVLVFHHGKSNLEKAEKIDNYYGFIDGIGGEELYKNGLKQALNLKIDIRNEEVLDIEKEDVFIVSTENNNYQSKTVIISTGNKKLKPDIKGISEFEGKGISYCAICDGFLYKNKNVAVLGNGKFALSEAEYLKNIVNSVTILTNGEDVEESLQSRIKVNVIVKRIKEIHGESKVKNIEFEDGSLINVDGIFIALGEAGGVDFAKKLGVILENDSIKVNENMETNINGLYACGNVTGGLLQISKSVYEGTAAGLSASSYIKKGE